MEPAKKQDPLVLVADIGGTNARFALMDERGDVVRTETRQVAEYPTFLDALDAFLEHGGEHPTRASFAVAGPVTDGHAAFTNSPWTIDRAQLRDRKGFDECLVINDFRALSAYALSPPLGDLLQIKPGQPIADAPVLVIGPGTGLGQSLAVPDVDNIVTVPTEGGHVVLAASTDEEDQLIELMEDELGRAVTGEDVVSGSGLERLHRAMLTAKGQEIGKFSAPDITQGALAGDPMALATVNQFLLFLGTLASNAALSTGARRGVLLAGGILPRVREILVKSGFTERFIGESPMADYLRRIPVHLIIAGDAALRGAYVALRRAEQGTCATPM
ncbi:glucokinase [Parvularcula marina]|uniref:glucokinase n=1 Tax=Parvularcula marina TaxID=2292771 RepID=UPI0035140C87